MSEDSISRKDTLDKIDEVRKDLLKLNMLGAEDILTHYGRRIVEEMPTNDNLAHWIVEESEHGFGKVAICSNCNMDFWEWMSKFDYCPNCGARMVEEYEADPKYKFKIYKRIFDAQGFVIPSPYVVAEFDTITEAKKYLEDKTTEEINWVDYVIIYGGQKIDV